MLNKNDIITLEIIDISNDGNGVGRYDDVVIFVPMTAVGDVISCRIVKVKKNYCYGIIDRIISSSADRIESDCPVFRQCGGCAFRHMTYEAECRAKEKFIKNSFERIGKLSPEFEEIIPCDSVDHYRNKAQYPVADREGKAVCGFYAKRSHRVVECHQCRLQPPVFEKIVDLIMDFVNQKKIKAYNEITGKGLLRHIYLRRGEHSGEILVCLVITSFSNAKIFDGLVPLLTSCFPDIKSIVLNENGDRTNVILGERIKTIYGKDKITDIMCGNCIEISPLSFYQVNTCQAEKLYRYAFELANAGESSFILDLYCGAGTIGLSMARKVKNLVGVEIVPESIENAKNNAAMNGIKNCEFICGDAGNAAKILYERSERPDIIIADPARKGCDTATLEYIARMSPERIVMISCNHTTAARDCAILYDLGYRAEIVRGVDMFPRTTHVETVVLLSREFASAKDHVYIDYEPDSDIEFPASATYTEIKAWVQKEYGLKVSSLYVAQVKQKHGIIEYECHNKPKSENSRQPKCPLEKEAAIEAALKHFKMI